MHEEKIKEVLSILMKGGISRGPAYEKLFNTINHQVWIKPLYDNGFFQNLPHTIRTKDSIFFPTWVESKYLARMAPYEDDSVDTVVQIIYAWDTDNERIHEDMVDIIMGLPIEKVSSLVEREIVWIREVNRLQLLLPYQYQKLISYLAKNKLPDYALNIAEEVLLLIPDIRDLEDYSGDVDLWKPEPQTKIESSVYEHIIEKSIPKVFNEKPLETLSLLFNLLNNWIELSRTDDESGNYYDYSSIWRHTIENSKHNINIGIDHALVNSIRDLTNEFLKNNPEEINEIDEKLSLFHWTLFKRFSMYFIRSNPDKQLLKKYLLNRDLLIESDVRYEYALLSNERFQELDTQDQNLILQWIAEGPDVERYKKNMVEFDNQHATDKEVDEFVRSWKQRRLSPLFNSLNEENQKKYSKYFDDISQISDEDYIDHKTTTWMGPTSPKTFEEVSKQSIDEIMDFLKIWVPSKDPMAPSPLGLGRVLKSVVSERSEQFSDNAIGFKDLQSIYIQHIISGFNEALRNNKSISWKSVIELCEWIISQPMTIPDEKKDNDDWEGFDYNWGSTKKSIADLFDTGLSKTEYQIPFELRDRIWCILNVLIEDPNPTIDQETQSESGNFDPFTYSINCVRGEAMHCLIRYGLWCKENLIKEDTSKFNFSEVPELLEKLNTHLDKDHDPSHAVRSVYGHWFPWLILMDEDWAKTNIKSVFPEDERDFSDWKAAWMGYIMFRQPYNEVLPMMHVVYKKAIDYIGKASGHKASLSRDSMNERLVNHLMTFYWRGAFDLSEDGLVKTFFSIAPVSLKQYALLSIGRGMKNNPGDIEEKYLIPVQDLWNWRVSVAQEAARPQDYADEMASFGVWFGSGKFDAHWSLIQLDFALNCSPAVKERQEVIKQLIHTAKEYPVESIRLCERILEGKLEPWDVSSWEVELRQLFLFVINSTTATAKEKVLKLINRLSTMGYYKFNDIWKKEDSK